MLGIETNRDYQSFQPSEGPFGEPAAIPEVSFDEKSQKVLGKAFWKMAELYKFTREEQAVLLGIKYNRQRLLQLEKDRLIPLDPDKFIRVGNLMGIHKNLKIFYTHHPDIVYEWMRMKHDFFNGKSPLEFIMKDPVNSFSRIFTVRRLLDQIRVS